MFTIPLLLCAILLLNNFPSRRALKGTFEVLGLGRGDDKKARKLANEEELADMSDFMGRKVTGYFDAIMFPIIFLTYLIVCLVYLGSHTAELSMEDTGTVVSHLNPDVSGY